MQVSKKASITSNASELLNKEIAYYSNKLNGNWPNKQTAFLVVNGIGNQKPIETLEILTRGLISAIRIDTYFNDV